MHNTKKIFISGLLGLGLALIGSILLGSHPVQAKAFNDMTVGEQAESITYYSVLGHDCVEGHMYGTINTVVGTSGDATPSSSVSWFDTSNQLSVFDGSNIQQETCTQILKAALQLWGWGTSYNDFLTQMGYTFKSSIPAWVGPGDPGDGKTRESAYMAAIEAKIYTQNFASYPTLSGATKYIVYKSVFKSPDYCSAKSLGLYPSGVADPTYQTYVQNKTIKDGYGYIAIDDVGSDGRVATTAYKYDSDVDNAVIYGDPNNLGVVGHVGERQSCTNIASTIASTSTAYAASAAETACKTTFKLTDPKLITACAQGYAHNTDLSYCTTTYPSSKDSTTGNKDARLACYKGQGNEAEETCRLQYTDNATLQACIDGSNNKADGYCDTQYSDRYVGSQLTSYSKERDACKQGQTIKTSGDKLTVVGNQDSPAGADTTSCAPVGIGWILCPVSNAIAGMADWAYQGVSAFLNVQPLAIGANNDPLYNTWSSIRNIANVAFVIMFLIIIISQVSGFGVSNYGVKKTLPRLIIAAILINLSYYICAIAVDLSNILGVSLKSLLTGLSNSTVLGEGANGWSDATSFVLGGGVVTVGAFTAAAVAGTSVWGLIVGLLPLLLSALLALLVALLVLVARQALILIFVVIAPLAFVAYLLPNTESWFKKWLNGFVSMLALFPMLAIVFGGAQLASSILMSHPIVDFASFLLYIGGMAVQAIPFFLTPILLRLSNGALGQIGNLANGAIKKRGEGLTKWGDQKAKNAKNSAYANNLRRGGIRGIGARLRSRREAVNSSLEQEAKRAQTGYIAGYTKDNAGFRSKMAGAGASQDDTMRVLANAQEVKEKLEIDEVNASKVVIKNANLSGSERQALAVGKTVTKGGISYSGESFQRAGLEEQLRTGNMNEIREIMEYSAKLGDSEEDGAMRGYIARNIAANGLSAKDPGLAGKNIDQISQGLFTKTDANGNKSFDWDKFYNQAVDDGRYNGDTVANMNSDGRNLLVEWAKGQAAAGNTKAMDTLTEAKKQIMATPTLQAKVTDAKSQDTLSLIP